jgi:hypothetical protein
MTSATKDCPAISAAKNGRGTQGEQESMIIDAPFLAAIVKIAAGTGNHRDCLVFLNYWFYVFLLLHLLLLLLFLHLLLIHSFPPSLKVIEKTFT